VSERFTAFAVVFESPHSSDDLAIWMHSPSQLGSLNLWLGRVCAASQQPHWWFELTLTWRHLVVTELSENLSLGPVRFAEEFPSLRQHPPGYWGSCAWCRSSWCWYLQCFWKRFDSLLPGTLSPCCIALPLVSLHSPTMSLVLITMDCMSQRFYTGLSLPDASHRLFGCLVMIRVPRLLEDTCMSVPP